MQTFERIRQFGKWGGRLAAVLIALLWGAFLVEHLREWFLSPNGLHPPTFVWIGQALHFCMVAGFVLMVKWERAGTILALVFSIAFFGFISRSISRVPAFALMNLIPSLLFCLYWFVPAERRNSLTQRGV